MGGRSVRHSRSALPPQAANARSLSILALPLNSLLFDSRFFVGSPARVECAELPRRKIGVPLRFAAQNRTLPRRFRFPDGKKPPRHVRDQTLSTVARSPAAPAYLA